MREGPAMRNIPYQLKEAILAIVIIVIAGLSLDRWGHDMTNRLAIIFGAIALFAWAHFFILVRHKGPRVKSWLRWGHKGYEEAE
jgi:ABC-type dipeptide/oligopeptide/nickel transport system permease subunit